MGIRGIRFQSGLSSFGTCCSGGHASTIAIASRLKFVRLILTVNSHHQRSTTIALCRKDRLPFELPAVACNLWMSTIRGDTRKKKVHSTACEACKLALAAHADISILLSTGNPYQKTVNGSSRRTTLRVLQPPPELAQGHPYMSITLQQP